MNQFRSISWRTKAFGKVLDRGLVEFAAPFFFFFLQESSGHGGGTWVSGSNGYDVYLLLLFVLKIGSVLNQSDKKNTLLGSKTTAKTESYKGKYFWFDSSNFCTYQWETNTCFIRDFVSQEFCMYRWKHIEVYFLNINKNM